MASSTERPIEDPRAGGPAGWGNRTEPMQVQVQGGPSLDGSLGVTAVAVTVGAAAATVVSILDPRAGGTGAEVTHAFGVIAAALFLGAGVLRIVAWRRTGEHRRLLLGTALVVLGGLVLPLTGVAGVLMADDDGSFLRAAVAVSTTGVVMVLILRAVTSPEATDHGEARATATLVISVVVTLLLFGGGIALHVWVPEVLRAGSVPPLVVRGALLALAWLYVGLEAALRGEERSWAGRAAPLLGCMGIAEALRVVSVYHDGGWDVASTALVAGIAAVTAYRALCEVDEVGARGDAGLHPEAAPSMPADTVVARTTGPGTSHLDHLVIGSDPGAAVDFSVTELVGTVVEAQRADGARVRLESTVAGAHGRPEQVATALHNVIANAREHGGNDVTVQVSALGDRVEVLIRDHGPGLGEAQVATLFQRGARGPASRGSGLGLHVSRTLMRQQGGDLELRRHVGGAEFALVLPVAARPSGLPATRPRVVGPAIQTRGHETMVLAAPAEAG